MSILNTQDIENDISVIEHGYSRAITEYGSVGRTLWPELYRTLQQEGLQFHPADTNLFVRNPGEPLRIPHNNSDDYNLDEIARLTNSRILDSGDATQITLDWFMIHDGVWLELIGKWYNFNERFAKQHEFHFYFNMTNMERGQFNWR